MDIPTQQQLHSGVDNFKEVDEMKTGCSGSSYLSECSLQFYVFPISVAPHCMITFGTHSLYPFRVALLPHKCSFSLHSYSFFHNTDK